jgi:hypothetical protein
MASVAAPAAPAAPKPAAKPAAPAKAATIGGMDFGLAIAAAVLGLAAVAVQFFVAQ